MASQQEQCDSLRKWINDNCGTGHVARDAAYRSALSAFVHRFIKYGPEPRMDDMTARDILNMAIMQQGDIAGILLRTSFTRAIIENDMDMVNELCKYNFMPEPIAFYKSIVGMILKAADEGKLSARLAESEVESKLAQPDKSIGRLLIARSYPMQMKREWLTEAPLDHPRLCAELLAILFQQRRERPFCEEWIKGKIAVAMAV